MSKPSLGPNRSETSDTSSIKSFVSVCVKLSQKLKNNVQDAEKANTYMKLAKVYEEHGFRTQAIVAYALCCNVCMKILMMETELQLAMRLQTFDTWLNAACGRIVQFLRLDRRFEAKVEYDKFEIAFDKLVGICSSRHPVWPFIVVGNEFLGVEDGETALYIFEKCIQMIKSKVGVEKKQINLQLGLVYTLAGDATSRWSRKKVVCKSIPKLDKKEVLALGIKFYKEAIALNYKVYDAYCGIGNNFKALGKFEEALSHYQCAILEVKKDHTASLPPSYIFNTALTFEALGRYEEAINIVDASYDAFTSSARGMELNYGSADKDIDVHALRLYLVKLVFVGSKGMLKYLIRVPSLIEEITSFPIQVKLALKKKLKTHWAYYVFIKALYVTSYIPPTPIYALRDNATKSTAHLSHTEYPVVGDSHVLSIAWQHIDISTGSVSATQYDCSHKGVFVPYNITGLMAWHIGCLDTSCVPFANLDIILRKLCAASNGNIKKCLFFAGEIDCRESIHRHCSSLSTYKNLEDAVNKTAEKFVEGMWKLSNKYGLEFYIVAVIPPVSKTSKAGRVIDNRILRRGRTVNLFNEAVEKYVTQKSERGFSLLKFVNIYKKIVSQEHGMFLEENFICDDIHSNSNLIVPLHEALVQMGFYI